VSNSNAAMEAFKLFSKGLDEYKERIDDHDRQYLYEGLKQLSLAVNDVIQKLGQMKSESVSTTEGALP